MSGQPEAPDHADVVALPPVIYLASLGVGLLLHFLWPLGVVGGAALRIALGVAALGAGVLLVAVSIRALHRTQQDPDPRKPTPALVFEGPFLRSRNPIYVGLTLIQLGIGLALGSAWILLMLVPALLVMHYGVVLREEAYLERKFGDAYREYVARVRRWL